MSRSRPSTRRSRRREKRSRSWPVPPVLSTTVNRARGCRVAPPPATAAPLALEDGGLSHINYILDLRPWFTGEYIVRMQSGKELTLTRNYRDALHRLLGKRQS